MVGGNLDQNYILKVVFGEKKHDHIPSLSSYGTGGAIFKIFYALNIDSACLTLLVLSFNY